MSLREDGVGKVGVGDRKNPKADGAGRLRFDKIRVTKAVPWRRGRGKRKRSLWCVAEALKSSLE